MLLIWLFKRILLVELWSNFGGEMFYVLICSLLVREWNNV